MAGPAQVHEDDVRAAEIIASLSLATDLAMGFPWEHGFHATSLAMRLGESLGVDDETARATYFVTLLLYSGCNADAPTAATLFGGSLTDNVIPTIWGSSREQFAGVARALPAPDDPWPLRIAQLGGKFPRAFLGHPGHQRALCEVAQMLAERLGLPPSISEIFFHLTDRWDGRGVLRRGNGEEIPLPLRIAMLAHDAAFQQVVGGREHALRVVGGRAGGAFEPRLVRLLADVLREPGDGGRDGGAESVWDATLAAEPRPYLRLAQASVDRALGAAGDFADLVSPMLSGHAAGVAALADRGAAIMGLSDEDARLARRAALVEDVGRVTVSPQAWARSTGPSPAEQEQLRLHPYFSQRVLEPGPTLRALAELAACHHERLDGSGYHRGVPGQMLPAPARLLAAADAFRSLTEARSNRPASTPAEAASILAAEANAQRLDAAAVEAVIEAAGQVIPPIHRAAGLTERESQVLGLLARGLQTKQVATSLGISVKTADRHVQHVYRKIGVASRAGATLFAMEHGLVPWGELPMSRAPGRP